MQIRDIPLGHGAPLVLISGLNVLESLEGALACAASVQAIAERHGLPAIFKASFDKANRSSHSSFRGPGLDEGLRMLQRVKAETGLPITTDVHEPGQAKIVAEVADLLQIPSFLSRQTDLVAACAGTGRPLNVKKGQFMAPADVALVVEKAERYGAGGTMVTERGTSFGYNDLVVDMRSLVTMREYAPVCLDATHAVQNPGGGVRSSSGDRRFVSPLARAGVAVGIDALFVETHADPDAAPCDSACQIRIEDLDRLLAEVCAIRAAVADARP
ncbi:MAG: 3-deoxy-8-phosphooctulonate synthase [Myxococcales bacterium]|nr:3-deoxy-8-phosphooctulonate synthase [Myxococcales bacterium]MDH5305718.1 3-deoxy-8-phosphooctulonate synthase [Myxococcales bacterium]MDH5565105.1 3-deoxy-8-phosphooctulonate synthase [Myxococcales bacterium]